MLKLDGHELSPSVLNKVVTAGGESPSYDRASKLLRVMADVKLSGMQISRLTHEVGEELRVARDRQGVQHREGRLPSAAQTPVPIACVQVDGGRIRTRQADAPPGVHDPAWKESKVACLWRMDGKTFTEDPHPELPKCFRSIRHVKQMVREIKNAASPHADRPKASDKDFSGQPKRLRKRSKDALEKRPWPPQRKFRTVVATLRDVHRFGPLVAAEAQHRGFYDATRQVFLGDGDHKNWTIHKLHFPKFVAVTDFVHVTSYLYEAAGAVTNSFAAQWEQYIGWATDCWQGRVEKVLEQMDDWTTRLEPTVAATAAMPTDANPSSDTLPKDAGGGATENVSDAQDADERKEDSRPAAILARSLTYLRNNQPRMNYPSYRTQGLPVNSCLIESTIKQINQRVKGSEKFWSRPDNAEAVLQVRAALLCDDNRLTRHILSRPGRQFRRRPKPAHCPI